MARFDPTPEGRNRFLRKFHKTPLHKRAKEVLGSEGFSLLNRLEEAFLEFDSRAGEKEFERWARNILNKCAHIKNKHNLIEEERRRRRYVEACITKQRRISELEEWIANNPDPNEVLDDEQLRAIEWEDLIGYYRQATQIEFELEALRGEGQGLRLLGERIGYKRAWKSAEALMALFDLDTEAGHRRFNAILSSAALRQTRFPEGYIRTVIENEKSAKRWAQRQSRNRLRPRD